MRQDKKQRRLDSDDEHETQFAQEDERKTQEDLPTQVFDDELGSTKPSATIRGVSNVIKLIRSRTGGSGVTPLD